MMFVTFVLLFHVFSICPAEEYENKSDRFIIACHTTDYLCFKRQYYYLRDHVFLGSEEFDIPVHQPYQFQYPDTSTCVRISGVEESQLAGISFQSINKSLSMTLAMPVRLQQVERKNAALCEKIDKEFSNTGPHIGPLKNFSGNATIVLTLPYILFKKEGKVFMKIEEDILDVIMDIPEFSKDNMKNKLELEQFDLSEWAYNIVQLVDIPERTMVPYVERVKKLYNSLPLERLILLYPPENYTDLVFQYRDDDIPQ